TMVYSLPTPFTPANQLPPAFFAPRVTLAVESLVKELKSVLKLARPIKHTITSEPDFGLPFQLLSVEPLAVSDLPAGSTLTHIPVHVRGNGFQTGATVSFGGGIHCTTFFRSEGLLVALIDRNTVMSKIGQWKFGSFDVNVINADRQPAGGLSLAGGFTVGP